MNKCIIKKRSFTRVFLLFAVILVTGCAVDRQVSRSAERKLRQSGILNKHFVGFALYSMDSKKMLRGHNAEKYFTPASNTKLFTFFSALKMFPDRVPSLRYIEKGDSLIFWGTGDPSVLQTKLRGTQVFDFLRRSGKRLFFAPGRYTGDFYGSGWQWDDYNDYYQAEINELPVMDNLISVRSRNGSAVASPERFKDSLVSDSRIRDTVFYIRRDFSKNIFRYPARPVPDRYEQQIPYKVSAATTAALLSDTLKVPVGQIAMAMPDSAKTLFGLQTDSVLKEMMLPSDNFIAEQLLLVCSDRLGQELNAKKTIAYVESNYLAGLSDKLKWADGSGLSRYNLFTPRDMVRLLELIYTELNNKKRLFELFPAGGKSGTLRNAYPKTDLPFVFAKTGSLSNIYNQSGFLVTKKGRLYLFSFMNNNFAGSAADVRKAMSEVMSFLHERY